MVLRNTTLIAPEEVDGWPINSCRVFTCQKTIKETRGFPARKSESKSTSFLNSLASLFDYLLSQRVTGVRKVSENVNLGS